MSAITEEEKLSTDDNPEVIETQEDKNDILNDEEEEEEQVANPKIGWMNLKFAKFKVVEEKIEKGTF